MKHAAFFFLAAMLAGCESMTPDSPVPATASLTFEAFAVNTPRTGAERTNDEMRDMGLAVMDVLSDEAGLSPIFLTQTSLQDAEALAETAFANAEALAPAEQSVLRQTVASLMIQRHLDAPDSDVAAVERYAQMLLDDQSPNAHLIAEALPALRATWGEARVRAAAAKAATDATEYLDRTCPACNASALARGQAAGGPTAAGGVVGQQQAIQAGIRALEAI